eukprot:1160997-Pelagomonas_calceolata.AAC.20
MVMDISRGKEFSPKEHARTADEIMGRGGCRGNTIATRQEDSVLKWCRRTLPARLELSQEGSAIVAKIESPPKPRSANKNNWLHHQSGPAIPPELGSITTATRYN